jgi:hypothetical protein
MLRRYTPRKSFWTHGETYVLTDAFDLLAMSFKAVAKFFNFIKDSFTITRVVVIIIMIALGH